MKMSVISSFLNLMMNFKHVELFALSFTIMVLKTSSSLTISCLTVISSLKTLIASHYVGLETIKKSGQ